MSDFNDRVITQFRASGGEVGAWGDRLVLIHSVGARSGTERVNPAMSLPDGENWMVIASAAGAAKNPGWYHNLVAHPDVTIETAAGDFAVTATELSGEDHQRAWQRFRRASPAFEQYQEQAGDRTLPIFRFTRR